MRYAITGVTVHDGRCEPAEGCTILVADGRIEAVGPEVSARGAERVHDLEGCHVTPGIIDAHCHVGVFNEGTGEVGMDGNDYSDPITPEIRALDGIYTDDEAFDDARASGMTTLGIAPGSANVIGGQIAAMKTRGNIVEEMTITDYVGLKCAFGENPKRVYGAKGKMPTTRMGVAAKLRMALMEARLYGRRKAHHLGRPLREGETRAPFKADYRKEVILRMLHREVPMRAHAHRADDIQSAVRVAGEFGIDLVVEHCTEGHLIADYLARKDVPVIIGPLDTSKSKVELRNATMQGAKRLEQAGVSFALMTDAPVKKIGSLIDDVRNCVRHGVSRQAALAAVTEVPARIMGMTGRIGSLRPGADADIAVFEGDPFDFMSGVRATLVDGVPVHGEL
jgi:imidazolonepropionase-like amidohydrolase